MIALLLLFTPYLFEPEYSDDYEPDRRYESDSLDYVDDRPTYPEGDEDDVGKGEFAAWLEAAARRYPPRLVLPALEPRPSRPPTPPHLTP